MKVMVTGGCGFLGSHVCERYARTGDQVICFDNMTKYELLRTGYSAEEARNHNRKFLSRLGVKIVVEDIRNAEALTDWSDGCDYLIHTAAQPAMTISWEEPGLDFSTNVIGTFNVLETARLRRIPVASCATIHVYGAGINDTLSETETRYVRTPAAIDEDHPTLLGSLSPLHASKMAGDTYVRAYGDAFGVEAASFRLTGIYGPRQLGGEDHGWVANFAIRAVIGAPLTVFGSGKQLRDILYVTDAASAFEAFYRARIPGVYNIGGGVGCMISLLECIDLISDLTGTRPEVRFEKDRFGDLRYFVCDIGKARRIMDWSPVVEPREGLQSLIRWIEDHIELFRRPRAD
jgi:CDP-paratose 2-epimerase